MSITKTDTKQRTLSYTGLGILYLVLAVGLTMMLTRHNGRFWNHLPIIGQLNPGDHLSNFALSLIFVPAAGLFPTLGKKFGVVAIIMAGLIVINFIAELWVTVLNTPDIQDAYWGVVGVIIGGLSLLVIDRLGTTPPARR